MTEACDSGQRRLDAETQEIGWKEEGCNCIV